jgi:hypothetical protein
MQRKEVFASHTGLCAGYENRPHEATEVRADVAGRKFIKSIFPAGYAAPAIK